MKVYIEVLVIFALMIFFIIWRLWFMFSGWRLRKKYKPENDKAKKGGISYTGAVGRKELGIDTTSVDSARFKQPEGRELLQTPTIDDARANSDSTRENSSNVRRRFFKSRRK